MTIALLAVGLLFLRTADARAEDALRDELERLGWEATERHHVPAVGLALVRGGELAWAIGCGWADLAAEREATGETVFNIGSISKTVAAVGLMRLVEQEKLALDAPVVTRRWQLPPSSFDAQGVTLRRLLSHTAGLSLHGYPGFWPPCELPTVERSLSGDTNGAGSVELERAPGTLWKYSGGGYTLAQLLLEETTGEGFADYMRANVLEPLGMTSSAYGWTDAVLERSATPYDSDGNPLSRGGPCFAELAAAGLQTTPADLGRFAAASLARFRGPDAPAVLARETIELMQSPAPSSPEYGLGFQVREEGDLRLVGHGGANDGWMAQLTLAPQSGDALVVLTNGSNGQEVIRVLERAWIAHLSGSRAPGAARSR